MANRPKPHHLKAVTGNPGRRPLAAPPAKAAGEVVMPPLLVGLERPHAERARRLWDEKAPTLIALEILNPMTATLFGNWCELQARYEWLPESFNAALIGQLRYLASSFGLDAVSWEKLTAGKGGDDADENPAAAYFG